MSHQQSPPAQQLCLLLITSDGTGSFRIKYRGAPIRRVPSLS